MNEKEPKRKRIPRQVVMREVFESNYGKLALPPECVGCKNRLDLPCEGCDHWESKKVATQSKKLAAMAVDNLNTPTMARHDIVDDLLAVKHNLEEELDRMCLDDEGWDVLRGRIQGFGQAIRIVRETK